MGKRGTKRKTRWRALPLGEENGGSGNEEELHEDDQSTTSSVYGQNFGFKVHPPVFKTGNKPFRPPRRFPYVGFKNKEPLIKLESKTFDEEEYTKITTPRQDVLFKKGYFGRKRDFSTEETAQSAGEVDGEEPMMDQYIITNGFLDERGHYYVNGSSYEVYDPCSNTVTVVVGPPPYTNGVTQPLLAAVSCQPVPLQPVEWYPPGNDWPSQGSAWTPSYPPGAPPDNRQNSDGNTYEGSDNQASGIYPRSAYVVPVYMYGDNPPFNSNGVTTAEDNGSRSGTETSSLKDTEEGALTNAPKSEILMEEAVKTETMSNESLETRRETGEESVSDKSCPVVNCSTMEPPQTEASGDFEPIRDVPVEEVPETVVVEARQIEKQSHSTQTSTLESEPSNQGRVKESHSTQTMLDESKPESPIRNLDKKPNAIVHPIPKAFSGSKNEQGSKPSQIKGRDSYRSSPKHAQDDSGRRYFQKSGNEERKSKPIEDGDFRPFKTTYAKKVLNGLPKFGDGNIANHNFANSMKMQNGSGNIENAQMTVTYDPLRSDGRINGNSTIKTYSNKVYSNDKFNVSGYENKRKNLTNGHVKNSHERPRYKKNAVRNPNKTANDHVNNNNIHNNIYYNNNNNNNNIEYRFKDKKQIKLVDKSEVLQDEEDGKEKSDTVIESRSQSEKSSTVSELSSPTELSSGQNTPPEKTMVCKMEEKIANDFNNKNFEDKLKQSVSEDEVEETVEEPISKKHKKKRKNKSRGEVTEEPAKSKTSKSRKRKKGLDGKAEDGDGDEDSFLLQNGKSNDFLFKAWESINNEEIDPVLSTSNHEILESLGIKEKWNVPKVPLGSDMLVFSGLSRDRPKFKFQDLFSPATKQIQNDLYTKSNITSLRSTKPEEFFATVVEAPTKAKSEKKEVTRSGKKNSKSNGDVKNTDGSSTAVKKNSKSCKMNKKESMQCKTKGIVDASKFERDTNVDNDGSEKNGVPHEEPKLGIVDAVNSWLQEQGNAGEKMLTLDVLAESLDKLMNASESEDEEPNQKNGLSNPIHAPSAEDDEGSSTDFKEDDTCIRVANLSKDDGCIGVETAAKHKGRLYRSSSWDAKLSEVQFKKHFKLFAEASSWDRNKLRDLVRHFKLIKKSADFCQHLIRGDIRNGGYEYATEELCDPRQTVSKYYTLSPSILDSYDKSNEIDSENEVFDALEYKFTGNVPDPTGNLSITDSGVHSDMESNDETGNVAISDFSLRNKEVLCKMQ